MFAFTTDVHNYLSIIKFHKECNISEMSIPLIE